MFAQCGQSEFIVDYMLLYTKLSAEHLDSLFSGDGSVYYSPECGSQRMQRRTMSLASSSLWTLSNYRASSCAVF
jgi:hypothetical protein